MTQLCDPFSNFPIIDGVDLASIRLIISKHTTSLKLISLIVQRVGIQMQIAHFKQQNGDRPINLTNAYNFATMIEELKRLDYALQQEEIRLQSAKIVKLNSFM